MMKTTQAGKRAYTSQAAALSFSLFGTALLLSPAAQANSVLHHPALHHLETDALQIEAAQIEAAQIEDVQMNSELVPASETGLSAADLIMHSPLDGIKADATVKPLSSSASERTPLRGSDRLLELQQARIRREQLRARLFPTERTTPETISSVEANPDVYLYGQQPVANQIGTAYFVFEAQEENITGAFYMPGSSFDCASGYMGEQDMELTITDSYSQEIHQYALGLTTPPAVVASQQGVVLPTGIEGFHPLPVTERDRTILAICQARR